MAAGVTIEDSATTFIDRDVAVGSDTIIHPGVSLEGTTTIGGGCEIHSGARIVNSRIGDRVTVFNHCVITDSTIAADARIGPFAHLRPQADVRAGARVGNFVELKNSVLGAGSKANHLSYLGDAIIGDQRQHRRRHHHVQLRRRDQEPDGDRGRRLRRQRQPTGGAGDDRQRRLRGQRHDGARRRAGGRAGGQRREAAQHRRLGRRAEEETGRAAQGPARAEDARRARRSRTSPRTDRLESETKDQPCAGLSDTSDPRKSCRC